MLQVHRTICCKKISGDQIRQADFQHAICIIQRHFNGVITDKIDWCGAGVSTSTGLSRQTVGGKGKTGTSGAVIIQIEFHSKAGGHSVKSQLTSAFAQGKRARGRILQNKSDAICQTQSAHASKINVLVNKRCGEIGNGLLLIVKSASGFPKIAVGQGQHVATQNRPPVDHPEVGRRIK